LLELEAKLAGLPAAEKAVEDALTQWPCAHGPDALNLTKAIEHDPCTARRC